MRALEIPVVATLHAIPRMPTPHQRTILSDLIASVDATVVMSKSAVAGLASGYGVDPLRLDVIPHGVPDLPLAEPDVIKASFGLEGRDVILSFGLLSPAKGYDLVLEACRRSSPPGRRSATSSSVRPTPTSSRSTAKPIATHSWRRSSG